MVMVLVRKRGKGEWLVFLAPWCDAAFKILRHTGVRLELLAYSLKIYIVAGAGE